LLRALEKFSDQSIQRKSSSPKILPLAPCLYQISVGGDYSAEERGRVFELVVGAQLVRTGEDLFYWREGNDEVDYVLKVGRKIYAIEVKSGRRKRGQGIMRFIEKHPRARAVWITPENYHEFENDPLAFLARAD
jgi:predicted AAA+ superfamily ATPase